MLGAAGPLAVDARSSAAGLATLRLEDTRLILLSEGWNVSYYFSVAVNAEYVAAKVGTKGVNYLGKLS